MERLTWALILTIRLFLVLADQRHQRPRFKVSNTIMLDRLAVRLVSIIRRRAPVLTFLQKLPRPTFSHSAITVQTQPAMRWANRRCWRKAQPIWIIRLLVGLRFLPLPRDLETHLLV